MVKLKKFEAPWCSTCKTIQPYLDSLGVEVEHINVEEDAATAKVWGVRSLPTIILLRDGMDPVSLSGTADSIKVTLDKELGKK